MTPSLTKSDSPQSSSLYGPLVFLLVLIGIGVVGLVAYIAVQSVHTTKPQTSSTQSSNAISRLNTTSSKNTTDPSIIIDTASAPSTGVDAKKAKITIVEFLDFQCPYCKESAPVVTQMIEQYKNQPVRFVFRNLPLTSLHPYAVSAAHAGLCANEQGKFLAFYTAAYDRQSEITNDALYLIARDAGLEMKSFASCMANGTYNTQVQKDFSDAVALGAQGTPTWFINGQRFEGALSFNSFTSIITQLLNTQR